MRMSASSTPSIRPASPLRTPMGPTRTIPSAIPALVSTPNPRFDFQLGQANTLTLRYEYYHASFTNGNVGELALPEQATNGHNEENTLQASDSIVMSKNFVDNIRFRYRRIRNNQSAQYTIPSVTVSGAFTDGGSNSGSVRDNQDDYEVQDYFTGSKGRHALNFGGRLRAYRDANYSNAGTNGSYTFTSLSDYLAKTPQQYQGHGRQQQSIHRPRYPVRSRPLLSGRLCHQSQIHLQLWPALGNTKRNSR